MKKTTSNSSLEVKVARFNEPTVAVTLNSGASIQDALDETNITLGSAESIWVNGELAQPNDIIENGDILSIVGKKEGGNK